MGIPFGNTIIKGFIDAGVAFATKYVKNLKEKTDLDKDGVKDFDECILLIGDSREQAHEIVEAVDSAKLSSGVGQILAGVNELKSAIQGERAVAALKKLQANLLELLKLAGLLIASYAPKGDTKLIALIESEEGGQVSDA